MATKHYEWRIGKPPPILGDHSVAKHRIIDRYVRKYLEICTSTPVQERLNLTIVDGFSGGGRYRYRDEEVPGSPLVLLDAVAEIQDQLNRERRKGFEIRTDFLFVDIDRRNTDYLQSVIEQSSHASSLSDTIHIWTDDFNERIDDVIGVVKRRSPQKGRSLFLLDQYSWKDVTFRSIRRILGELEKAEIFLTFMVDSLIDFMTEKRGELQGYRNVELDHGFIQELLKEKTESKGWRMVIQNELYSHLQEATGAEYYSPFFIRSPEAHRSYWFLHLSRHREARNVIGNIHWDESNVSLHHGRAGLQALGFTGKADAMQDMLGGYEFDETARRASRESLLQQIPQIIRDGVDPDRAPSLEQLFGSRCNDTPVTRELFEEALVELRQLGEVRIEDIYGKDKPRSPKVSWSDRIVLARQPSLFGPFGPLAAEK
ncbi:three-Cys-motif partner protein TcmP [Parvularcula sp. ZS-1/3]|uniref:Three-Cys-motif partner protein TcmP n=1 Tax=Parvularcula mediterranea TaxID=2732508 RepID=A0A7Y3RNY4_9PROT|nr:three-Cys-motif partner protein TcmP [Parvularcula mediterranea]NNU17085.1 three-Cys-motif partner protein TcmP [Parvularcula mediterranea]